MFTKMSTQNENLFKEKPDSLENRAYDLMVRGRHLSAGENFNQEAFDLLSKAIKLNPYLIEGWIELTKCYQQKSDIDGAIACLENALKYCDSEKPNKIILRKLSTCIRQKDCDSQEAKIAALLRSLELSKQALKSDLYDEENYYDLAKAYMCLFFVTECVDQQLINLSRAAYSKALTLSSGAMMKQDNHPPTTTPTEGKSGQEPTSMDYTKPFIEQSDFLFNYSTVLVYLQEFQKALEYLRIAIKLDPTWDEPKTLEECLVDYLRQIHLMMNELNKNNKKVVKRYCKVVETLKSVGKIESIINSDQQRLQRSQDVRVRSCSIEELESKIENLKISSSEGADKEPMSNESKDETVRVLHLKLINTINYNQAMYLTFIGIDINYSITVVTIYSLAASRCPTSKDIVTLVNPKMEQVVVDNLTGSEKDTKISFKRINIREFKDLYVNGFRITTDQVSKPQFRVSVLP